MASLQSDVNKGKELVETLAASRAELPTVCSTSPRPRCQVLPILLGGKEYPAVPYT